MIKFLGALLFVLCGGMLGYGKLYRIKNQLSIIESMENALALMDGEILHCERALPDIYQLMTERSDAVCRAVFLQMSEECLVLSAGEAWRRGIKKLELEEDAEKILLGLGDILGVTEGQRQSAEIKNARAALSDIRNRLAISLREKGKSYPMLGFCFAGIAALLII